MDFETKKPETDFVAFEKANYLYIDFQVKETTKHTSLHGINRVNSLKSIPRSNKESIIMNGICIHRSKTIHEC